MQVLSFQPPVPSATAYAYPTQHLVEVQAHGLWSLYIETWFVAVVNVRLDTFR